MADGVELRSGTAGYQILVQELRDDGSHALVNHELGNDQQGNHDEELHVGVDVLEERHGDAPAQQMSLQCGEDQEGEPREKRDDEDAPFHHGQGVV